tara:strand:+ start:3460 stop:4431 length:972 start_codon:yes stop_codon:yes gene_type:complete
MKQKNKPTISVVMSTYNEPLKWITESIDSILNQTFSDFEFIIINDNPKRKELQEFLEKYKKQDKRILLIKNKQNIGLTKSLNKGLRKAKGKYIARMDADDISLPKRFQIQYDYLEKHGDIFLIGGGLIQMDKDKKNPRDVFQPIGICKIKKILKKRNCIYHPTIMFRNRTWLKYREKMLYVEDYDLYLRLIAKGLKLENLKETLLKYRVRLNSICHNKKDIQIAFQKKARELYVERIKKKKDSYKSFNASEMEKNFFLKEPILGLESKIKKNIKLKDYKLLKINSKKGMNKSPLKLKFYLYYFYSMFPKFIKQKIRSFFYKDF